MLAAFDIMVAVYLFKNTLYGSIKYPFVKCAVLHRFNDLCVIQSAA